MINLANYRVGDIHLKINNRGNLEQHRAASGKIQQLRNEENKWAVPFAKRLRKGVLNFKNYESFNLPFMYN